jgi:uncharacterized protein (TIGR03437 family)
MFLRRLVPAMLAAIFLATVLIGAPQTPAPVTVSAASYEGSGVAPGAIAATFGTLLSAGIASGTDIDPATPGAQLPTQLLGTSLEVNGRPSPLLFVSPGQINFVVPPATELGTASVVVLRNGSVVATGTVTASRVIPGVFTANSDGQGVAAALAFRVRADSSTSYEPVAELDPVSNRFVPLPISLGPPEERVFLVIFSTGIRGATDENGDGNVAESVHVLLGGVELVPTFAGAQGDFVGLDQINVEIPRSLIGRGELHFSVVASGSDASNEAAIAVAAPLAGLGPLISSFTTSALAGDTLVIRGSGFSTNPAANVVLINGIEAIVTSASPTELIIIVPFGVQTGNITVRTPAGESASGAQLQVRTSISGFIENTARQPLSGVMVRVVGTDISAQTTTEGSFVLADVPTGTQYVDVDGEALQTSPPYPKVTLKTITLANRDNQLARPVSLQQSDGGSGNVGGQGLGEGGSTAGTNSMQGTPLVPAIQQIETGSFSLTFPVDIDAVFPRGATSGRLYLTPVAEGRTPVDLPGGVLGSNLVQITPFNVQLKQGAKLTFPNVDNLAPNVPAKLYRYDPVAGEFVEEPTLARVSADGLRIETVPGAIKITSYYFAGIAVSTSTLVGRVLTNDGSPVKRALVSLRGQEAFTDGNGGYVLRLVAMKPWEWITLEASFQRPDGRIERVKSTPVPAYLNQVTKIPDIRLGGAIVKSADK